MLDVASGMRFGDAEGLKQFALAHRLAHAANASAIAAQGGGSIPGFDVGDERVTAEWAALMQGQIPTPTHAVRDWLTLHALVHEAEYEAVGFGIGTNLTDVNFSDAAQFNDWMFAHMQAHDAVNAALGIS